MNQYQIQIKAWRYNEIEHHVHKISSHETPNHTLVSKLIGHIRAIHEVTKIKIKIKKL